MADPGRRFILHVLPYALSVCRLRADEPVPLWARDAAGFVSCTRTDTELSIVCRAGAAPTDVRCETGWRALQVRGTFPFSEVGVLLAVIRPLNDAGVSILAVSTFDTDYVLVKESALEPAIAALAAAGHRVERS